MDSENKAKTTNAFIWVIIVMGTLSGAYCIAHLSAQNFSLGYLILASFTLIFGSRIIVQIPRSKGRISVSDTFIMLSMLLFGGGAAILLAGADSLISSLRATKRKLYIAFNTAVFLISTSSTVWTLEFLFGPVQNLAAENFSSRYLMALTLMGCVQYILNSGLVAIGVALRVNEPIWKMWRENFLWTSLTYFAGASAAGIIAKMSLSLGIYAFIAIIPIIAIIYFTYCTYLKNVESISKQAEQAQSHVEELNKHIAEQTRISNALKESEEHFRTAFDHAVGMALVTPSGRWSEVNESLCLLLGYKEEELQSKSFRAIIHPDDLGETLVKIQELLDGLINSFQMETRYYKKSGETIWVLSSASVVRAEDGAARHMVFQIQNISDRKQAEDQIRYAAFHDPLTGLPNRTLLADRISISVERAKRSGDYKFAVLFIDLDRFKVVNDSMGHEMGDKLLVNLSKRLKFCIRAVDTVARLGGDEFAVLLDGIQNENTAIEIAERIQEHLRQPFDLEGQEFFTSASIGISFSALGYSNPEDILRDADTAMYRAKSNGKARYEIFDLGMHTRAVELLRLETDLRQAIEKGEIIPHFQPIVSLPAGIVSGFEALARWQHSERRLVSPADFIPLAEETGLIVPLGMQMFKESCEQLRRWQQQFPREIPLTMSINLSGKQFAQKDLVEEIGKIIEDSGIKPHCIRIEVTESVVMDNAVSAIEILKKLKTIGVQLSIDDFGTGYSSLSYLHRFPFDILKIDRSFVSRMALDKDSRSIVETILALASKLEKRVVAEGVETDQHRDMLSSLSCDYAQGYLFSKPLSSSDAEEFLKTHLGSSDEDIIVPTPIENIENSSSPYAM